MEHLLFTLTVILIIFSFTSQLEHQISKRYTEPCHLVCLTYSYYARYPWRFCPISMVSSAGMLLRLVKGLKLKVDEGPFIISSKSNGYRQFNLTESKLLIDAFSIDPNRQNYVRDVRGSVFSVVFPEPFKNRAELVAVSPSVIQNILDIKLEDCKSQWFLGLCSGSPSHLIKYPLAHRYGGHQFGEWAGQLGDGRAVLLGEYVNLNGERWEVQLKGSGRTPYSRHGDGRAVLRSSVREFLASEAMYHLGIRTSRAASLVLSEDKVKRDQFYDGNVIEERAAIVLRLAKSWFRIGSLEILQVNKENQNLISLVDFMIENFYPALLQYRRTKYNKLFATIVNETAELIAKWMSVGFAHGVCNTDNFSLLSITIDYGPFGFMEAFNPDFIPNTSDDTGLYRYSNQPNVGYFNLDKLMQAMSPIIDGESARRDLNRYMEIYRERYMHIFAGKLGLLGREKDDQILIESLLWLMSETKADFTMTFRELGDLTVDDMARNRLPNTSWSLRDIQRHQYWKGWLGKYKERLERQPGDFDEKRRKRMHSINPRYILRNYMAKLATELAEQGDYSEVTKLLKVLSDPFTQQVEAEASGYASKPPSWSKHLKVSCSS